MSQGTALVVIDMQNDFVLPGAPACIAGAMATVPNIAKVLGWFRQRQLPVFHVVREYRADGSDVEITRLDSFLAGKRCVVPGTEGCEIVDELKPVEGEYRVVKNRYSAFLNTELDFMLRRLGVRNLVNCGTQYPNCVRATVYDAVSCGYGVTLVTDATSAQTREIADANILDIRNIGVECIETQELIADRVRR